MKQKLSRLVPFLIIGICAFAFQNCGGFQPSEQISVLDHPSEQEPFIAADESLVAYNASSLTVKTETAAAAKPLAKFNPAIFIATQPRLIKEGVLERVWQQSKDSLRALAKSTVTSTPRIYDLQIEVASFLQYAYENKKKRWMSELMDIYLEPAAGLQQTSSLVFYYPTLADGTSPARKVLSLSATYPMWLVKSTEGSQEIVLNSAQFLYAVTLMLHFVVQENMYATDPVAKRFYDTYAPVALGHYRRWVFKKDSPAGYFQVAGWGCGKGTYSHLEFTRMLAGRKFNASPSYCNVVTDKELFLYSGVMNLMDIKKIAPSMLASVTDAEYKQFISYAAEGVALFKARTSFATAKDSAGVLHPTANFDLGSFDDHVDFAYSGDTGSTFPGYVTIEEKVVNGVTQLVKTPAPTYRPPKPAKQVGWDISHARRLVLFLFSLREFGVGLGVMTSPELEKYEVGMTNQMLYVSYNGNIQKPSFSNYMSGHNGWYRVNYDNRGMTGAYYPPYSPLLFDSVLLGGYGFWGRHNEDWNKVMMAAEKQMKYVKSIPYRCLAVYAGLPASFFLTRERSDDPAFACPVR